MKQQSLTRHVSMV